jgi:hypothetical protein
MRDQKDWDLGRADKEFSLYIRTRDRHCMNPRCPHRDRINGLEWLECSHYFSRTILISRFDPENCFTLCHWCHALWENTKQGTYTKVMIRWLGQNKFDALVERVETYKYKNIPFMTMNQAIKLCREFLQSNAKN